MVSRLWQWFLSENKFFAETLLQSWPTIRNDCCNLFVPYNHLFLLWFTLVFIVCVSMILHLLLAWVGQKSMTRLQRNLWLALWRRLKNYLCWSKNIMYFHPEMSFFCVYFNLVHNSYLCPLASLHTCLYHARPFHIQYETNFVYTGLFSQGDITIYTPTNKMDA